VPRWRNW